VGKWVGEKRRWEDENVGMWEFEFRSDIVRLRRYRGDLVYTRYISGD
jgi:hypothetical protein